MADNMLKMYEAVQVNQYWEIAIRQDSIIENQALLKAFCSLEHYETVITMLTDYSEIEDLAAFDQAWDPNNYKVVNEFWAADFVTQWIGVLTRTSGWAIAERKDLKKCGKTWGKGGEN